MTKNKMVLMAAGGVVVIVAAGLLLFGGGGDDTNGRSILSRSEPPAQTRGGRDGMITIRPGEGLDEDDSESLATPTPRPTAAAPESATDGSTASEGGAGGTGDAITALPGDLAATPVPTEEERIREMRRLAEIPPDILPPVVAAEDGLAMAPHLIRQATGGPGGPGSRAGANRPLPTPYPTRTPAPAGPTPTPDPNATETPVITPSPSPTPSPTPEVGRARLVFEPSSQSIAAGETATFNLILEASEKAVGGYTTLILFNPLDVKLRQVREGTDTYLGYPFVLRVDNDYGTIIMSSFQGASFDRPTGRIHLGYLDFEGLTQGTTRISLTETEVSNTTPEAMILEGLGSAVLTVTAPPEPE